MKAKENFYGIELGFQYEKKLILLEQMVEKLDAEGIAQLGENIVNGIHGRNEFFRERIVGIVYYHYAVSSIQQDDYDKAWVYIVKALSSLQSFGNTLMLAKIYLVLGEIVLELDDQASAIESYLTVIEIGEEKGYPVETAKAYFHYGEILIDVCHYEQAKDAFISSVEICIENQIWAQLSSIYVMALTGATFCLWWLKDEPKATMYYKKLVWFLRSEDGRKLPAVETRIFGIIYQTAYGEKEQLEKVVEEFCQVSQQWEPIKVSAITMRLAMKYLIATGNMLVAKKILAWMDDHCEKKKLGILNQCMVEIRVSILVNEEDCEALFQAGKSLIDNDTEEKKKKSRSFHKLTMMRSEMNQIEQREFEIKMKNEHLLLETLHDSMTGLPNRTFFTEQAHQIINSIRETEINCVVGIMDIDCFKMMNDTYGHVIGDESIISIAEALKEWCSNDLFCARYGGDEFVVIGTGFNKKQMEDRAEELKKKIKALDIKNSLSPVEPYITLSQGYFIHPMNSNMNLWKLLGEADNLMYEVKKTSKNGYLVSDELELPKGGKHDTVTGEIIL